MNERQFEAVSRPQVVVAFLAVLAALALLLSVPRAEAPAPVTIDLAAPSAQLREGEATILLVDEVGEERVRTVRLPLPAEETARLTRVVAELRELSMQQGVWPPDLPVPRIYLTGAGRGAVAVFDMQLPAPVGVSVEQESALVRSLVGTALRNGASEARFLRNGRPTDTLLGHVAVGSAL